MKRCGKLKVFLTAVTLEAVVFMCIGCVSVEKKVPRSGDFTIIFINDTHGQNFPYDDRDPKGFDGGAARWATLVKNIRGDAENSIFLHSGDMLTGSTKNLTTYLEPDWVRQPAFGYRGLLDVEIFNRLGLDAMAYGNHDFDYGLWWTTHLFKKASFDLLSANLKILPENVFDNLYKPYQIYEKGPFTVGVIGALTKEYLKCDQIGYEDAFQAVRILAEELRKKTDILIVLSHLGDVEDQKLAEAVPGIDVIVGGHSHRVIANALEINGAIITQAGSYGQYVGRLDLSFENGVRTWYRYSLIPASPSVAEDPEIRSLMDESLYPLTLVESLSRDGTGVHSLGDYLTAKVGERFPADAVLLTVGNYEGELPAGPVAARDFFTMLWPYQLYSHGPDKEYDVKQLREMLSGENISDKWNSIKTQVHGLKNLIRTEIPPGEAQGVMDKIAVLAGAPGGYALKTYKAPSSAPYTLLTDLPSWMDLYKEKILKAEYPWEDLDTEIIEVLLAEKGGKESTNPAAERTGYGCSHKVFVFGFNTPMTAAEPPPRKRALGIKPSTRIKNGIQNEYSLLHRKIRHLILTS